MQKDLFATAGLSTSPAAELVLDSDQLRAWQQRLHGHQAPLFRGDHERTSQTNLFGDSRNDALCDIDPLALTPLPLTFWRWPDIHTLEQRCTSSLIDRRISNSR